jgi:ParB family chromosome partitioning protein
MFCAVCSMLHINRRPKPEPFRHTTGAGRQGVTLRLHAGLGADNETLTNAFRQALAHLDQAEQDLNR